MRDYCFSKGDARSLDYSPNYSMTRVIPEEAQ